VTRLSLVAACLALAGCADLPNRGFAERMRGSYSYMADSATFLDCKTGRRLPVVQEGDNRALEAAYLGARRGPGGPVLATVDGRVEDRLLMDANTPRPALVVERFVSVEPGRGCDGSEAPLVNTYWKLLRLRGAPVELAERQREPHFILQSGKNTVIGSGGCNGLSGTYALESDRLSFGHAAVTRMACAQGMAQEQAFLEALGRVARWRISGERLELLDASNQSIAEFESRYLR
jgi:copper homeostasis protein (lipoprotein)